MLCKWSISVFETANWWWKFSKVSRLLCLNLKIAFEMIFHNMVQYTHLTLWSAEICSNGSFHKCNVWTLQGLGVVILSSIKGFMAVKNCVLRKCKIYWFFKNVFILYSILWYLSYIIHDFFLSGIAWGFKYFKYGLLLRLQIPVKHRKYKNSVGDNFSSSYIEGEENKRKLISSRIRALTALLLFYYLSLGPKEIL